MISEVSETQSAGDLANVNAKLIELAKPFADIGTMLVGVADKIKTGKESGTTGVTSTLFREPDPYIAPDLAGGLTDVFASTGFFDGTKKKAKGETQAAKSADEINQLTAETAQQEVEADQQKLDSDKKYWASKLANAIAGSKKLAALRKKYAIAATIVNTSHAIMKTFAELGFLKGLGPVAALAAQGAQQIATIKGQAHSGLDRIPSTGTYLLEKGERVVGKRLNQDLSGFLQTASSSVTNSVNHNRTSNNSFNPTINMKIDGGADQMAISDSRGQMERMIREIYADYAQTSPFGA